MSQPRARSQRRRLPTIKGLAGWIRQHGAVFSAEVLLFWSTLLLFQFLGYGGKPGGTQGPTWYLGLSLLMSAFAIGVAEVQFKLYRRIWTVASINDAFAVAWATLEATLLVTLFNLLIPDGSRPYRLLVPVLAYPATLVGIGFLRLLPRLLSSNKVGGHRLLIVVGDSSDYATVKTMIQHPAQEWSPCGIITGEPLQLHRTVMGIPVVGTLDRLAESIRASSADGVAFVLGAIDSVRQRELFAVCLQAELPIFIVPRADEWFPRTSQIPFRRLSADDLVGRAARQLELSETADKVRGTNIMVTGAAGSIGAELCRLLNGLGPRRMVLVDINESGLFDLAEELRVAGRVDLREALVSVVDRDALLSVMSDERPDIVFHAAAYKHVPMLESHPAQAVTTNVMGTWNTIRCAEAAGVRNFVLISTDKAAARHSVMGCTKRLCELMVLAHAGPMKCWAVRFGNVVGSRGSVIPLFERQIEQGGPVTITHPEMSRYMMTVREATSLVITSLLHGAPGHLYMLDMGEPIKIMNLAQSLIRSRGLRPGVDIEVVFTGLRPGERLTEDLLAPEEGWRPTPHPAIREVISPNPLRPEDLSWIVNRLEQLVKEGQSDELVRALKAAVRADAQPVEEERTSRGPVREREALKDDGPI